jgi:hypothetical protein
MTPKLMLHFLGMFLLAISGFTRPATTGQPLTAETYVSDSISRVGKIRLTSASVLLCLIVSSKCRSAAGFPPATTRNTFLEFL